MVAVPLSPTLSIADYFSRILTPPLPLVNGKCLSRLGHPMQLAQIGMATGGPERPLSQRARWRGSWVVRRLKSVHYFKSIDPVFEQIGRGRNLGRVAVRGRGRQERAVSNQPSGQALRSSAAETSGRVSLTKMPPTLLACSGSGAISMCQW